MDNFFGTGGGNTALYYVDCTGNEDSLVYCSPDFYDRYNRNYPPVSIHCYSGIYYAILIYRNY